MGINCSNIFLTFRGDKMYKANKGTLAIGWCDNGNTDGKFTEGIVGLIIDAPLNNINITNSIRVQGNQIGRQRQILFDHWAEVVKSDWLLCVDSDIVLDISIVKQLWNSADENNIPVISGTYFISKESETTLANPYPALFYEIEGNRIDYVHPLPKNQIIKVDIAGLGLTLMHKSIIPILRKKYLNQSIFSEKENLGDEYVSEDIVFFRNLKNANIPLYAHTGAIARHVKRFSLDDNYYNKYWGL